MPHVVTFNALVSGFITSPVGAQSSVNVSDYMNDFRFQRHIHQRGSSSALIGSHNTAFCMASPSTLLFFLLRSAQKDSKQIQTNINNNKETQNINIDKETQNIYKLK
ncbi:hypothetical protein EYF80_048438 [Liparis tanakae]|uniref:Uncharacterized protein n=1 Tax=Liparis tanakae TaxID=230148 RepID=A0A4Z2FKG8_9TELE|nr:hypothetical protein EYF80_048438 [Liparis tanakae]